MNPQGLASHCGFPYIFVMVKFDKIVQRIPRFLTGRKFLIATGSIVGLFVLMNYIVLPAYVWHGGTLTVPNITGMPFDSARALLDDAGLQTVQSDTRPDPDYPLGTVINQNPQTGAVVKHGRRVYLTLSGGEAQVLVPSLRGRSTRDAKFALERYGLKLGGISFAASGDFPENTIIEQSISPEAKVNRGTVVNVTVSRGPENHQIEVPQLVGKSTTEAERLLLSAHLKVGNITFQSSFDLLPNTVVDQFPRAGEMVNEDQAVDLFIVKAGKPTEEIAVPKPER
jgi:beta-lactam-binding protein with PASTA domain